LLELDLLPGYKVGRIKGDDNGQDEVGAVEILGDSDGESEGPVVKLRPE
jgi:hypothetical protein